MEKINKINIFDSSYYKISKELLKVLGLWPYLSATRKNVSLAIFTIISFSFIIPIVAGFRNVYKDIMKMIENCIGTVYFLIMYSKYVSVYIFEKRMKLLYEQIIADWESLTDKVELEILHRYSREGRILTMIYVGYSIVGVVIFNSLPYVPVALDKFFPLPLNQTREHPHPYHPDYLVINGEEYFFELFAFHGIYVVAIVTSAAVAIDSMMFVNIKHVCGLFAIVWSVNKIQDSFNVSFLFVTGGCCIIIGMLMFDFLIRQGDPIPTIVIVVLLIGVNICLFFLNWIVQQVINSSEEVFYHVYFGNWYNLSIRAQKLLIIIMQKSIRPCSLTAGSIVNLNLEMYASIVKTAMSYTTVMLSMQQE